MAELKQVELKEEELGEKILTNEELALIDSVIQSPGWKYIQTALKEFLNNPEDLVDLSKRDEEIGAQLRAIKAITFHFENLCRHLSLLKPVSETKTKENRMR